MDMAVVELSRLQFALTAMYHFLFVPLTLGLSFLLVIMESIYVMTGKEIWRVITRFWGKLFGINFVLGVATGITMEFEFGTNWSYYAHYVGDIFGAPLAIEGLMAFFLEATFVGLMFFGWDRLSKVGHLAVTFCVALGSNLSALWILIANGWMQNPAGATFNPETMRMEVTDFYSVLFNPVAQAKFVHTVSAGYVCASVFVMGVSAWYLLKGKWTNVARRSMVVAAAFGLASSLSVVVLGDESGYALTDNQKMKLAAIEGMWHTEEAPAGLAIFGIPDPSVQETRFEIKIPYVLGLIATRSLTGEVVGINELVLKADERIRSGLIAYDAVEKLKFQRTDPVARESFEKHKRDLGYAMLLKRYVGDPRQATDQQILMAAKDTIPNVPVMFWLFRIMAGLGFFFIGREAEARGVDPARLVFSPSVAHGEHLGRLVHADLFLDTFAVNAHTTASDALWAGLPVLTLAGQQFAARVAASLVTSVGLPEMAVESEEAYAALALDLARDPARLAALRERLAENRSTTPLFDTVPYTRRVEAALERMHQRQLEGQAPDHFAVD
ncbi:MAG: cytochrome d terminal oxidase subunit 1 [Novosphingobium sp.]|nr:cytochrome d terminal oxidase subunit 1 [Novosphingobium sp.]